MLIKGINNKYHEIIFAYFMCCVAMCVCLKNVCSHYKHLVETSAAVMKENHKLNETYQGEV